MSTLNGTSLPNNVVRLRPDLHQLQGPDAQKIRFVRRLRALAVEGANATWATPAQRRSWVTTAESAAAVLASHGIEVSA